MEFFRVRESRKKFLGNFDKWDWSEKKSKQKRYDMRCSKLANRL